MARRNGPGTNCSRTPLSSGVDMYYTFRVVTSIFQARPLIQKIHEVSKSRV